MQKILFFIFAVFFTLPAFSQRQRSLLKVRDQEGRNITVEINGRRYNKVGKMLTFKDLPARNHALRIYVVKRGRNGRNARLIYKGNVRTRPGKIYYVTVDDYEGLDIIEDCCLGDNGPWNIDGTWYRSRYYDQQSWEEDIQFNPRDDHYYNYKKGDRGNQRRNKTAKDDWQHYDNVMSRARFNNLIRQMEDAGFESNRMQIVQQALKNNSVSTNQLVSIMKNLSFESSRLTIAKMAYPSVADKRNAFQINQGFSFSSSKDEFNRFLQNQR